MADHETEEEGADRAPPLGAHDEESRRLLIRLAAALAGDEHARPAVGLLGGYDPAVHAPADEMSPERLLGIVRALMGELEAVAARVGYDTAKLQPGEHTTLSGVVDATLTLHECHVALIEGDAEGLRAIAAIREHATDQRLTPWDALERIRLVLDT